MEESRAKPTYKTWLVTGNRDDHSLYAGGGLVSTAGAIAH